MIWVCWTILIYIWQIFVGRMQDDLKRGLLSKKGSAYDRLFEDCLVRIQRIKQKNDVIQKQIGPDIEDDIREEIHKQRDYLQKEINQLKNIITQIQTKYRDPESRNRTKQLKLDAQKQIERNKIILKDIINKSFIRRSIGLNGQKQDSGSFMQGGVVNYTELGPKSREQKQSMLTDQQMDSQIEIDYQLERKIMLQKNEMINEVEQSTMRINQIMNDMGVMVDEQGQNLDVISQELLKTNQNMVVTNQNMDEAQQLQKKAKKKYMFLVVLLLLILVIVGGILWITLG